MSTYFSNFSKQDKDDKGLREDEHAKQDGAVCFEGIERLPYLPVFQGQEGVVEGDHHVDFRGVSFGHVDQVRVGKQAGVHGGGEAAGEGDEQEQEVY